MGNKESEQVKDFDIEINHPRFTKSKIVGREGEKELQTSQAIDEKEHEKWTAALTKYKDIPDNLLLPKTHAFSRTGLCGNTGTLLVSSSRYRSTTQTIRTCWSRRSTTARDSRAGFRRLNSGDCCSL